MQDEKVRRKEQHSEKEKSSEADFELLFKYNDADVDLQDVWTELAAHNEGSEKQHCADYRNLEKQLLDVNYNWHASDAYYQKHRNQYK